MGDKFMQFSQEILKAIEPYNLLKHPYYQAWNEGKLTIDDLKNYACQYFHHVAAFPRYLSSIHTNCDDIKIRQVVLDNLVDEEKGDKNHPQLWINFAKGLGALETEIMNVKLNKETQELNDRFLELSQSSTAEGIGSLFAYESQVPKIAESKIKGLKDFYGIEDASTLEFFNVHIKADEWHSQECADLIESMSPEDKQKAKIAAIEASKALWGFLNGMQKCTCN
jgi:pyrroloquinoline-quinone synthase